MIVIMIFIIHIISLIIFRLIINCIKYELLTQSFIYLENQLTDNLYICLSD